MSVRRGLLCGRRFRLGGRFCLLGGRNVGGSGGHGRLFGPGGRLGFGDGVGQSELGSGGAH